ncbi:MAG: hypothetical protein M2R45_00235 [Verrucomicrobia subdivision 3 bacterium]|nr:hypothetical protein [Limisphaerales bacterium]MCS1412307.1 hypothetical protein [Limisphaerales bacterium]
MLGRATIALIDQNGELITLSPMSLDLTPMLILLNSQFVVTLESDSLIVHTVERDGSSGSLRRVQEIKGSFYIWQ